MPARLVDREALPSLVDAAVTSGLASLAAIDLIGFKALNDEHGYEAGDTVLGAVENTLVSSLPKTAAVSRIGGDEWWVLFPGMAPEQALIVMEEIRSHVESRPASPVVKAGIGLRVGIAGAPVHATTGEALRLAAGEAVHRAKADGARAALYVEERMTMKSNYYPKGRLGRLAKLADKTSRTEASLLREALDDLLDKYADA